MKQKALSSLKGQWLKVILVTLIYFAVAKLLLVIIDIALALIFNLDDNSLVINILNSVIPYLLMPFYVGFMWFYLALIRSGNPNKSSIFDTFKNKNIYFKILVGYLGQYIFILLWSLLLFIPGIIKSIAYSQMFYLMKDYPEMTVGETLKESQKRMKGLKGKYFMMMVSFIGWGILAVLTFGIGLLWLLPYIEATRASFYQELVCQKQKKE